MSDFEHRRLAGVAGQLSSLADLPQMPQPTRATSLRPKGRDPSGPHSPRQATDQPDGPVDGPVAVYSVPGPSTDVGAKRQRKPVRLPTLQRMKRDGTRISAVTCYDATFARLVDEAEIDVVLVGDSLGNVVQGQDSTLPVTLEDILYHCRAVQRGLRRAHLVADMPFMTYHSPEVALPNAARLMAEGGAHAVKLEGGVEVAETIGRLVSCGIPVMAHIGLTPQSVHAMGGHRVQGRGNEARARLLADALAVEAAGAYAVVLEGIPARLAGELTAALRIPTIGIGAGAGCDGQILVLYDMLGLNPEFTPKFLKRFGELGAATLTALRAYGDEVRDGSFPGAAHAYNDPTTELEIAPLKAIP